ncbi:DNA-directed RNA polymerase III subunit rpc4 [Oryza brachyantha]|uniref:RNA polymerase III subunit C4 n=1 Tax=Oryza brachyantha TaxID=4533 RepID=J3LXC4_ORYBR|nr:DNA-directed RNA polymerase III subunit rpc4 [Oryza brachyantha]
MDNKGKVKKETDGSLPPPRKGGLKFAPKVRPKKPPKVIPKTKPADESKDETVDKELLMKLKTSQSIDPFARKVKIEKKEMHTQVAFGQGNSSYARSFPMPRTSADGSASKLPKDYVEPWDYSHSNYPVTLPLRRPYSGDPEILNEEEFGESSSTRDQDGELTAAEELGLMDRSDEPQLFFFQMPTSLPLPKQPDSVAEKDTGAGADAKPKNTGSKLTHKDPVTRPSSLVGSRLKELPGGFIGKILVYKSGKVKMKINDLLFDVSPGSDCKFSQEVAAINTREKHLCALGEISKRAVVTPDVDHLLDSLDKMEE